MIQRTLVLVKPDGVQRALVGEIIKRFENAGFKLVGMKMAKVSRDFASEHYAMHKEHLFYSRMVDYLADKYVVAIVLEGSSAVENVRKLVGPTEPRKALPGTIRGDFAHHSYALCDKKERAARNLIHASGTSEEAEQEINLWFSEAELVNYSRSDEEHVL